MRRHCSARAPPGMWGPVPPVTPRPSSASQHTLGLLYALAAYLAWGVFPAYWKQLRHVPAPELIAHRVLWSFAFVALLLTLWRRWPEFLGTLRSGQRMRALGVSTVPSHFPAVLRQRVAT